VIEKIHVSDKYSEKRHWFSLIERGKSYWVKVREIKKPI
jgi:hypothetical protein